MTEKDLGKLESVHGIAPAYLQRAAIIAIVSFVFFLSMLFAFSLRQNIGYFLLATAFLIVQLFTLTGWIMQKRTGLKLYENGFAYKKHICRWDEVESIAIKRKKDSTVCACEIEKANGEKIVLTEAIRGIDDIAGKIQAKVSKR